VVGDEAAVCERTAAEQTASNNDALMKADGIGDTVGYYSIQKLLPFKISRETSESKLLWLRIHSSLEGCTFQ
jgi:hypothetical protein